MDLSVLLGALTAADQGAKESNPFAPIQSAADGIGQALRQNAGSFSTSDNVWGGLATGLASGLLGNLSDTYQDKQNGLARQVLGQALSGKSVFERPEGMSPSVFAKLENTGKLSNLLDLAEQQKATKAAELGLQSKVAEKRLDIIGGNNPVQADQRLKKLSDYLGGGTTPSAIEPGTFDSYLQQAGGDESLARTLAERAITKPDRDRTTEDALRTQLLGQKAVQDFTELSKQYSVLQQAYNDPSASSDLDYAYSVAKALDPGSVVRESEAGMVIDSAGVPAALLGKINRSLAGGAGLGTDIRGELINLVQRRYDIQKGVVDSLTKQFGDIGAARGADPSRIGVIPQAEIKQAGVPAKVLPTGAVDLTTTPSAVELAPGVRMYTDPATGEKGTYQRVDGKWVRSK